MIINTEKLSACRVKFTCNVDAEKVKYAIDVCKIQKEGFLGSSTDEVFFKEHLAEIVDFIVVSTLNEAVKNGGYNPVGDPVIKVLDDMVYYDKGFTYTAEIEVFPEIVLGDYKNIEVDKAPVIVSENEVKSYISSTLSARSKAQYVEDEAQLGDVVVIDFEGFVDGEAFEGGKAERYSLELGSHQFIPGFEEQLVGMKKGESRDITVRFPEQYVEHLRGKESVFKIFVHSVERKILPTLTDELVKEINYDGATTVQELYDKVYGELKAKREKESEEKYLADYMTAIINSANIDVPEAFITSRTASQVKKLEDQSKQYGIPVEIMLQYVGVNTMDEYKERIREDVILAIKAELVFEQIAKEENLTVDESEVDEAIKENKSGEELPREGVKSYLLLQKARGLVQDLANSKMKEASAKRIIVMENENGEKVECAVLFTYKSEERGRDYVVFIDGKAGTIGAARYGDNGAIYEIESEEEWDMLQKLLDDYAENR